VTANRGLTKQGILEANRDDVIAALAGGDSWSVVQARYEVARPSLAAFVKRHRDEIDALNTAASEQTRDVVLTQKAERIRRLAWLADGIEAELKERGFMWLEPHGAERSVERMPVGAIKELRSVYRDIADELGDIPRPDVRMGDNYSFTLNIIGAGKRELG
jgi:hypothetical protein